MFGLGMGMNHRVVWFAAARVNALGGPWSPEYLVVSLRLIWTESAVAIVDFRVAMG